MLKQISKHIFHCSILNKHVCFGRNRPTKLPKYYMHEFLTDVPLPTPPPTLDWSPKALPALNSIYMNDQLGDCVIAGFGHMIGVWTGNTLNNPIILTNSQFSLRQINIEFRNTRE